MAAALLREKEGGVVRHKNQKKYQKLVKLTVAANH